MATYHNYAIVVGRVPGDDESTSIAFEQVTEEEARRAFADAIYEMAFSYVQDNAERNRQIVESRASNIKEHGGDLGVFIDFVFASQSPINEV
jgi:hypothetical protein